MEGWICPRCGKALAPGVAECDCKPEAHITYTKDTTITGELGNSISSSKMTRYLLRMCGNCEKTGNMVLTSNPPQYRCEITGKINRGDHLCDVAGTGDAE